jgi:4-hydroxybenzoate polyprenyltransferase
VTAELHILADVARYRIRRLEMANLAGAAALALALALPVDELAVRLVFGVLLNLLVYLNNDFHDRDVDLAAGGRERDKTEFLVANLGAAIRAQLACLLALVVIAVVWGGGLWMPLVLGGGVCWIYSALLKRRPVVDVIAMVAWGVAMPMVGVPADRIATALPLLLLLGVFSGVFESVQVLRDHDADRSQGVRTTAVVLGPARTAVVARALIILAAVHALRCFGPLVAAPTVLAAVLPMGGASPERVWNRLRLLCGLSFALACWAVRRSIP